jgi:hypothetical protein
MVSNLSWQTYRCCRQPERIRRTLSTCLNNNYINPIATNWWLRLKAWKLKFNFFHIYCITIVTQHLNRSLSNTVLFSEKKKQLLLCKKWDCKYTNLISISILKNKIHPKNMISHRFTICEDAIVFKNPLRNNQRANKILQCYWGLLTSWGEILSQLGGVLLYGKADAEIPLLQKKKNQMDSWVKFQSGDHDIV